MNFKPVLLFGLAALLGVSGVFAADKASQFTPNVVDETGDVSQDPIWLANLQITLEQFQTDDGIRVFVQFHAKSPSDDEDRRDGDYMRGLSKKLGTIKHGILMVHFADDPDWRVWIGDELAPKFVGKPGDAKEFTESGAMHAAKEPVLKTAIAQAATRYGMLNLKKVDPKVAATGVLLRLQTDAIVAGLRLKFAH